MKNKKKEDKKLTRDQAVKKITSLKKDLFNIRFKKINGQVENPAHSFKVDWEIEATDANGDREIAVPSSWTAENGNFRTLTIESNNIGATTSMIRVRAIFENGIGKSMTSWSTFEEPQ